MRPKSPPTRRVAAGGALLALLTAGLFAAFATTSAAAPAEECPVPLPLECPALPPLPVELPATATTTQPPPAAPAPATAPAASPQPAETVAAAAAPFTFAVRSSARKSGARRWIDLRISLSHPAAVVAVLRRGQVPHVASVFKGSVGTSAFVISVPRRVRAGRYVLDVVLARAEDQQTVSRRVVLR
jgi:hypothetical protein